MIQLKLALYILATVQATFTYATAIAWSKSYEPITSNRMATVARAVTYDEYGEPISTEATGCVQIHCGASHNTVPDFKTYYELTLEHNGKLLLYLMGTKDQRQTDNTLKWSGMTDSNGNKWGVRMTGDCGRVEYSKPVPNSSFSLRLLESL